MIMTLTGITTGIMSAIRSKEVNSWWQRADKRPPLFLMARGQKEMAASRRGYSGV